MLNFTRQPIVEQLANDRTQVVGLALMGQYLWAVQPVLGRLDAMKAVETGAAKSDFDALEDFRGHAFTKQAPAVGLLPSSPTLCRSMDAQAGELFDVESAVIETLLSRQCADYGVVLYGRLAPDVDTFAMNNGGPAKEGVGRIYAKEGGQCPLAAYLGSHGLYLDLALRPFAKHSAAEVDFELPHITPMTRRLGVA